MDMSDFGADRIRIHINEQTLRPIIIPPLQTPIIILRHNQRHSP